MDILFVTFYSLALAVPVSLVAGLAYLLIGLLFLRIMGLSEVRESLAGLVTINISLAMTLFTFLVVFAYLCRRF